MKIKTNVQKNEQIVNTAHFTTNCQRFRQCEQQQEKKNQKFHVAKKRTKKMIEPDMYKKIMRERYGRKQWIRTGEN